MQAFSLQKDSFAWSTMWKYCICNANARLQRIASPLRHIMLDAFTLSPLLNPHPECQRFLHPMPIALLALWTLSLCILQA
jgi:hypothetical protein